jgi:cell division protease FtsH
LLEPSLASLPVITSKHPDSCACKFSFKKKLLIIEFINAHGETVHKQKEQVHLQLQGLRSSKNDDLQAVTAVHEAGHAIVSALLLGILPNQILSVSTDSSSAGMVITEAKHRMVWGKEMVINKAAVCMAGLLAEKIIFGEENITGGSESDIKTATSLIVSFVKRQGLGDEAMYVDIEEAFSANAVFDNDYHFNNQVKYYLKLSQTRAEDILLYNKEIVVAIGKYLATHTTMSKNKFVGYLKCTTASGDVVDMKIPQNLSYKNILFNAAISNGRDRNIVIPPSYISLNKNVHQD